MTASGHIGILGFIGTIESRSYVIEIEKYFPEVSVTQEACPMWVPLVENGEADRDGTDYFVKQHIDRLCNADPKIDTIVLGCTHYPLLERKIRNFLPLDITIVSQGAIVARSLKNYLARHPEVECRCSRRGERVFYTSEKARIFERPAAIFYGCAVECREMRFG
jgi:glutamate racemase